MATMTEHVEYPHHPGRLYDCPACESRCHCKVGETECIYDGPHSGAARAEFVSAGDTVTVELPYSEVCMHMRVAGKVLRVRVTGKGAGNGAQIIGEDGRDFSFPILLSEAGFYYDSPGQAWYYYPPK